MGRRKISIQPITDERNRKVTFVKRKAGLFKKAHELAVLCQVDLAVIILGNNNSKFYEYNSVRMDELLDHYRDPAFLHDIKTPKDYGDYELESRAFKSSNIKAHHRNTSSVSVSIDDNINSSEDEDDDEDEEEGDEEEEAEEDEGDDDDGKAGARPPPKKRRTIPAKKQPKRSTIKKESKKSKANQMKEEEQIQPTIIDHHNQQQIQQQQEQIQIQQFHQQSHPIHNQQQIYYNMSVGNIPYGSRIPSHLSQPFTPIPNPLESGTVPTSNPPRGTFMPQGSHIPLHPYPYPPPQFSPSTPISNRNQMQPLPTITTSVVSNSQSGNSSPFSTARARSLNDSISSRPILRVETHLKPPATVSGPVAGDSALTITATDSKNDQSKNDSSENRTPSTGEPRSADEKPTGLGISSTKSTPLSATLPSGLFSLPLPQSSTHHQQLHHHHHHPNSTQQLQSKGLMAGEQTPLTGGLPSRYVPDLFPSPSNFYSNEWNIPFGSGSTPYPNSAGPANNSLPAINSTAGAKGRLKNKLLNTEPVDSPLQNLSKDSKDKPLVINGKKITFDEMDGENEPSGE